VSALRRGFMGSAPENFVFFLRNVLHFASFFMFPRFLCPLLGGFLAHGFLPMVFYFRSRN
jgi:hypothetical protein